VQCSVFIAVSLDGYIARTDGRIDWLSMVERPGEDYGYQRFHASIDTIVVGRNTYNVALGFEPWPYATKRCVVLTHAAPEQKHDEQFYSGSPVALVQQLAAAGAKRAYVDGGAVIQQFLAAGLINDLTLSVIPIVLGDGIRLFAQSEQEFPLQLRQSRAFESGLVQLEYVVPRVGEG
jgi:dihydrofolate reductase